MNFKAFVSVLFLVFSLPSVVFANADYMRPLRQDLSIPAACRSLDVHNFDPDELEYVTFSIEGAEKKGFTYEYPITRGEATQLWKYMKNFIESGMLPHLKTSRLAGFFDILVQNYDQMDFDFQAEGEILEALAIVQLRSELSDEYYVTGSLQYAAKTAGELDVIVGRKADCGVEVVGEAKLNIKKLNHAKNQLQRFRNFIHQYSPH